MSEFKYAVDEAAGEARLIIEDTELVLKAEMPRLVAVSHRLQCKSFAELVNRLSTTEAGAVVAGIEYLAIKGDVGAALAKVKLKHFAAVGVAFSAVLLSQFADEPVAEVAAE